MAIGSSSQTAPELGRDAANRGHLFIAFLACALVWANYAAFGDTHIGLRDEGYLWYGVRAVLAEQVPLRDFQAYDPGRYYWTAAWVPLFGDGVLGVRAASALFQVLGLGAGLLVARRLLRSRFLLLLIACALLLWMFPRHKLYESSLAMIGVWCATRLIERPVARRIVAAGVFTGLAACFGRNHGLYLGLAFSALTLLGVGRTVALSMEGRARAWLLFVAGALLGYLPVLAMMLSVDGFFEGFLHATRLLLEQGANLPVPYPWPWRMELDAERVPYLIAGLARGLAFLAPATVFPVAAWVVWRGRNSELSAQVRSRRAVLLAGLFVGVPYAHHFSVRADLSHLAQALHPLLFVVLALCSLGRGLRITGVVVLLAVALGVNLGRHPALTELWRDEPAELVDHEIGGDTLRLRFAMARHLGRVEDLVEHFVESEEELFIAPTSPTFYPLLNKLAPTWWIYFLWPASEDQQRATIRRLEERAVPWALIIEKAFDRDERYGFRETNPLVWSYLEDEFEVVQDALVPRKYVLFRRH